MKSFLPWVIILVLLGGLYYLYSANKENELKLAKVSADTDELDRLRQENEELKKVQAQNDDIAALRKDHEDLLRLRGETQRLRDENKQLGTQLSVTRAQSSQVQQAQQQLATENQALRNETAKLQETTSVVQQQTDACVNNLRMIDGAKQQWALENKKTAADVPTAADIAPYFPKGVEIVCPAGGTYNINAVGVPPTCSVPGHALPK